MPITLACWSLAKGKVLIAKMLIKVLDYITTKKIASTASLADRLGLSEEMVKQLLMELASGGYLDLIEKESHPNSCDSCAKKCADLQKSIEKGYLSVWMLTAKGKRAIKKLS